MNQIWRLRECVPAIEAVLTEGASRAGRGRELPEGAELLVCASGFDENTVTVLWRGKYYFVYVRHLCRNQVLVNDRD